MYVCKSKKNYMQKEHLLKVFLHPSHVHACRFLLLLLFFAATLADVSLLLSL
jgi:hypothetical protein